MDDFTYNVDDSFNQIINDIICIYHQHFGHSEANKIISILHKLVCLKKQYGRNHSSMPILLNSIGNSLAENDLSNYSISFFLEQLRIEKHYLGNHHHDLVPTLNRIGEIYIETHEILKAFDYFLESFAILNKSNKKGTIYAQTIYNIGLVQYHQASYDDAFEIFDLAIMEQRYAVRDYHPDVAKILVKVSDFQLEAGKLVDAMDNYSEALMIQKLVNGNMCVKVSDLLIKIGLIHKLKSEYNKSLNALNDALNVVENLVDATNSILVVLHEMCLIYQLIGDVQNTVKISKKIIDVITSNLGEKHICVALALALLRNIYIENGMVESSETVSKEIKLLISGTGNQLHCIGNDKFAMMVIELFGNEIDFIFQAAAAA